MTHIGFTGTKIGMSLRQKELLYHMLLLKMKGVCYFHHGDCIGADDEAANIAWELGHTVVGHPPIDASRRAHNAHTEIWREPQEYLTRNRSIVDESSLLVATPRSDKRVWRSGTWTTVRYAEKKGTEVIILSR
jgi:hypothetical protein